MLVNDLPKAPNIEVCCNFFSWRSDTEKDQVLSQYIFPLDCVIEKLKAQKDKKLKKEIEELEQLRLSLINHFQIEV